MAQTVKVWQDWQIVRKLGEGGFGTVYEIMRDRFSIEEHRALKVIRIPTDSSDVRRVMSEGMDENSAKEYYRSLVNEFIKEIAFLSELRGAANIVTYDDYKVIEADDGVGWEIYIMMELLTPLPDALAKAPLSEDEVRRLGADICDALSLCHGRSILHRDIKADNIFVTREGAYKLGDFGIARTVEKTSAAHTRVGTNSYMAPEIYRGQGYDARADIYSLGVLLYRLLNDNRYPFLPPYPQPVTVSDRDEALTKRLSGEPLPRPRHGGDSLCQAVLKACAFRPQDRFATAGQLKAALTGSRDGANDGGHVYPRSAPNVPQDGYDEYVTRLADEYPTERQNDPAPYREEGRGYDGYERYDDTQPVKRERYSRDDRESSSKLGAGITAVIVLIILVLIGGGITIFALLNRNAADSVEVEEDTRYTQAPETLPVPEVKSFSKDIKIYANFDSAVLLEYYVDGESAKEEYITINGTVNISADVTKDTEVSLVIDGSEYYSCTFDYESGEIINEVYNDDFYSAHTIY